MQSAPPPPPPPVSTAPAPTVSAISKSSLVLELRESVATLMARCKSLEKSYDVLEAHLVDFATKEVSMDTVLNTRRSPEGNDRPNLLN